MKIAALAGFLALSGVLVGTQQLTIGAPGDAHNQIRLDRPVGGSGGGGAAPAPSAPAGMLLDISVEDTLRIMRGVKFTSIAIEKGKTSTYIKAVIDDQPTYIWHNNCKEDRCRALHFAAYLGRQDSVTDDFIHNYNRNTMFTKMAKDKDGELQVTMAVSLLRGVSEDHIKAMGESWIVFFKEALAYKPGE